MCKLKSVIVMKDRVFCPEYDSHDKMLEELKIKDNEINARKLFVRVELSPTDGDIFSPVDSWNMNVDQDIKPDWFIESIDKARVIDAVRAWAENHIYIGKNNFELKENGIYYLKNCKNVTALGDSTVTAWGKSTVTARDNSTVDARDNSTVTACGNSTVIARDKSTVTACDNSTVDAWDNSTVDAWGKSTVTARDSSTGIIQNTPYAAKRESFILMDNSTLKDCKTKTIYQSGDWKFVSVED